jgi:peptidoglycan L-alanyl-D-glutamate endopeptidase CwlK
MPVFSKKSKERLLQCHGDLQLIFNQVIKIYDVSIICGHRSKVEQNKVYKDGNSKLLFPSSKHNLNPSMAVDVVPYPVDWKDLKRFYYLAGIVKAVTFDLLRNGYIHHDIKWGGDWNRNQNFNDQSFYDLPHYQLELL